MSGKAEPQFARCPRCEVRHGVVANPAIPAPAEYWLACAGCGKAWKTKAQAYLDAEDAESAWNRSHAEPFREWVKRELQREREKVAALRSGRWA